MKNSTILIFIAVILVLGGYFIVNSGNSQKTNANVVSDNGLIQQVTLGIKNYNYYPDTLEVKEWEKVSLTLDSSVYGCFRSFTVKELGIRAISTNPSEKIEFIPTKKGVFVFSCSMGMGYGKLIVK